jgi:hypothetical protein
MRRRMTPPTPVCYARFPWFAHYACSSLSLVGTKKERRRCCSWSLDFLKITSPFCALKLCTQFSARLQYVSWDSRRFLWACLSLCGLWAQSLLTVSVSSLSLVVLISKWCFELCFLSSRVFNPTKRRNFFWIRDHLNYAFWAPSSTQI